jgi:hypothetical protein
MSTRSRPTFETDVLDATEGDLYAVKEVLGHSSTRVTEVYLHPSRTRTDSATDALQAYRSGNRESDRVVLFGNRQFANHR